MRIVVVAHRMRVGNRAVVRRQAPVSQAFLFRATAPLIATQALIWITVAAFLLVTPGFLATVFYTAPLNDTGLIVARLFGAELAGLALASWVTRPTVYAVRPRPLFASYFACNFLGFLISAGASMRGATTATGWMLVFLYLFYAGAFAVLWLKGPQRVVAGPLVERTAPAGADRRRQTIWKDRPRLCLSQ